MQDESSRMSPGERLDQTQNLVLHLLLHDEIPGLWTVQEVGQAIGSEMRATDAIAELQDAGLVHRLDQFVFASRTAGRAMQLAEFN
jgi:hypothetical protein